MPAVTPLNRPAKEQASALAALDHMYGYYAFAWEPFAPARSPAERQAA